MTCKSTYNTESWNGFQDRWLADLAVWGRRDATVDHYRRSMGRFSKWICALGLCPGDVAASDIEAYVRHQHGRGLGGRSIAAHLSAIRSFFGWLERNGLIDTDPTKPIRNPKFRKPLPRILTDDQLAVLLDLPRRRGDAWQNLRDTALLRTLAWTGIRRSEAAALDWDDLDLTDGRATLTVRNGKGGRDRVVPLAEPLCQSLISYLKTQMPLGSNRAVWRVAGGARMSGRRIAEIVANYGRRIGVTVSPHTLRACCATSMIRAGGNLAEVRAVLGHAGYDTLTAYTIVAATEARPTLDAIATAAERTHR